MKRILRLDWDKCPDGYVAENRQATDGQAEYDGTLLEELRAQTDGVFITSRNALREPYRVEGIDEEDLACVALADTPRTPDGVVKFATRWGLLYGHNDERIVDAYREIDGLNAAFGHLQDVGSAGFLRALRPNARAGLREHCADGIVYGQATCLAAFCRHQLMELAEAEREVRRCHYCKKLYVGRIRTGNRREEQKGRFCHGGRCRKAYHAKGLDELTAPGGVKATRSRGRPAG